VLRHGRTATLPNALRVSGTRRISSPATVNAISPFARRITTSKVLPSRTASGGLRSFFFPAKSGPL